MSYSNRDCEACLCPHFASCRFGPAQHYNKVVSEEEADERLHHVPRYRPTYHARLHHHNLSFEDIISLPTLSLKISEAVPLSLALMDA